ncbi:hypothetical protein [Marinobacter sp. UBA3607]|jgi:hypothetical protein|uniref:hypothetical protein n=1 Tax=Marinobacter sp. UBA3607 TaxID=1946820 RepID=UPI00257B069A|nr:hypothetical protein [Marinobacter sp. UBA3607]
MTLLAQKFDPFGQVHLALGWAPSLLVLRAGTRGMGYFSSGKNNSLRSDIFFPVRKIPHTPLPSGSTDIGSFSTVNPPMPVGAGWLLDFLPEKDV